MTDWINRFKQEQDEQAKKKELELKAKLDQNRLIDSYLPDFWNRVVDAAEAQSKSLAKTFPDRDGYKTQFQRSGGSFTLSQIYGTGLSVTAEFDREGRRIKVSVSEGDRMGSSANHADFRAAIGQSDSVYFESNGRVYATPGAVAEWVVKRACGLPVITGSQEHPIS